MENFFRSKKTTVEMAIDRGYDVGKDIEFINNYDKLYVEHEYNEVTSRSDMFAFYKHLTNNSHMIVIFLTKNETGTQSIIINYDYIREKIMSHIGDAFDNTNAIITIVSDAPIKYAPKLVNPGTRYKHFYQSFEETEIVYNPNKSKYTSKVKLIENPNELIKKMGIKIGETPLMTENDPIAKYYAFRAGDLVQFTRNMYEVNAYCPQQIGYRTVVEISPEIK